MHAVSLWHTFEAVIFCVTFKMFYQAGTLDSLRLQ